MRYKLTMAAVAVFCVVSASVWAAGPSKKPKPDPRPLKTIMADFSDDNPVIRMRASYAAASKGAEVVPAMVKALKSKDWQVRRSATDALTQLGPDATEAVAALAETLKDKNSWVCAGAASALGKMGQAARPAIPQLVAAAGREDVFLREDVMVALNTICRGDEDKPQLLKAACAALMHPDSGASVRRHAFGIVQGNWRTYKPARAVLVYILKHPAQGMWAGKWRACAEILMADGESKLVIAEVTKQLKSESKTERQGAAATLGKFGAAARETLPLLKELASKDRVKGVRAAAKAAIESITAEPTTKAEPATSKSKPKRKVKGKVKKNK